MQWFKFWSRCLDSRKVQQLPAEAFRTWINLLCLAAREEKDGVLPGIEDLAWSLRTTAETLGGHVEALIKVKLIDRDGEQLTLRGWDRWQARPPEKGDPTAAERQRRYRRRQRDRKSNGVIDPLAADRAEALRSLSYPEYLKSDHWKRVRAFALDACAGRCSLCDVPGPIEVHHRSYDTLGREGPGDVIGLCPDCHAKHHGHPSEGNGNGIA